MTLLKTKTRTVEVIDQHATGEAVWTERKSRRLTLRECGRKLGVSASYVCDLENGRRNWGSPIGKKYLALMESQNKETDFK